MQSDAGLVLAWRQRLVKLGVTQPFKQAHREVYVLTDAERATNIYSNRFAGHVVEQRRFRRPVSGAGLGVPRVWRLGPGNGRPLKRVPERKLQVEFWVEPIETAMNQENFQFDYLSTDQFRFVTADGDPIALEDVDPVLFSELMRDGDLFVGVAGIGADPAWGDRGDDRFGEYWTKAAFGDSRKAARHDIRCSRTCCRGSPSRHVAGSKSAISSLKERSGRIASISVPGTSRWNRTINISASSGIARREVKTSGLPFEGDDTLSIILSKAFMLADDDKIKDASINSQIRGGPPRP